MNTESGNIIARALKHYSVELVLSDLCELINLSQEDFFKHFDGIDDLWQQSYILFLNSATEMMDGIPDFSSSEFHDRLSTFVYMLLDVLEGNLDFVSSTFNRFAAGYFSPFQAELRTVISNLLESPDVPGVNRLLFDNQASRFVIGETVVQLIQSWLRDDSLHRDRSIALIDRCLSFESEILTSAIPQRSIELIRYTIEADYLPVKNFPFIKDWFPDDASPNNQHEDDEV